MRTCHCGSGLESYELLDARGIYCGRVCETCESGVRSRYRPDIFEDSGYWADEPIDEEEPDMDDTVHSCPECTRPNQFGEVCSECSRDRDLEILTKEKHFGDEPDETPF